MLSWLIDALAVFGFAILAAGVILVAIVMATSLKDKTSRG